MESVWYCQLGEQVFGPINFAQLQALAQTGQVQPGTLLRQGEGAWIQAGQVPSLFAFAVPTPTAQTSPTAPGAGASRPQAARPTAAPVARLVAKPAGTAGGGAVRPVAGSPLGTSGEAVPIASPIGGAGSAVSSPAMEGGATLTGDAGFGIVDPSAKAASASTAKRGGVHARAYQAQRRKRGLLLVGGISLAVVVAGGIVIMNQLARQRERQKSIAVATGAQALVDASAVLKRVAKFSDASRPVRVQVGSFGVELGNVWRGKATNGRLTVFIEVIVNCAASWDREFPGWNAKPQWAAMLTDRDELCRRIDTANAESSSAFAVQASVNRRRFVDLVVFELPDSEFSFLKLGLSEAMLGDESSYFGFRIPRDSIAPDRPSTEVLVEGKNKSGRGNGRRGEGDPPSISELNRQLGKLRKEDEETDALNRRERLEKQRRDLSEEPKPDTPKPDTSKPDTSKPDTVRRDTLNAGHWKPEIAESQPVNSRRAMRVQDANHDRGSMGLLAAASKAGARYSVVSGLLVSGGGR